MLAKFSGLNPKGPYLSLEKEKEHFCVVFTYPIRRRRESEIRKFHVAVVQQRLRNVQKSVMLVKIFSFAKLKLLLFCCSPSPLQKLPIVVIHKFCYRGNVTSHFSLLLELRNPLALKLEEGGGGEGEGRQLESCSISFIGKLLQTLRYSIRILP